MAAGRVRAAGVALAVGLFLAATGCSGSTVTTSAPPASAPATSVSATTAAAAGVSAAGFPASFIGVSSCCGTSDVLAVYSATDAHLIRQLTVPMPGGGPLAPMSRNGRTLIFARGQGSCATTIDTVPVGGGREQVLVPMRGTGNNAVIPSDPSYSADGRYLVYDTTPCSPSGQPLVHIRDLSTGRELTRAGSVGYEGSVFLDHDTRMVFAGTGLEVLKLPSLTVTAYPAPRGCRYQALAGTETELAALLQCGAGHQLSVVAISARTFTVARTLIRLGSCLGGVDLNLVPADPSLMLAETDDACRPPSAPGQFRIVKISAGHAWLVASGPDVPGAVSW